MLNKDELEKMANEVVAKAERDAERMNTEAFIAEIKSAILKDIGDKIALHALATIASAGKQDMAQVARAQLKMKHTAYLIAEAAEKIMRRLWID